MLPPATACGRTRASRWSAFPTATEGISGVAAFAGPAHIPDAGRNPDIGCSAGATEMITDGKTDAAPCSEAAVAEFIRQNGITRCPTACVLPTQGEVTAADRAALADYATERERTRQARAAQRARQYGLSAPGLADRQ